LKILKQSLSLLDAEAAISQPARLIRRAVMLNRARLRVLQKNAGRQPQISQRRLKLRDALF